MPKVRHRPKDLVATYSHDPEWARRTAVHLLLEDAQQSQKSFPSSRVRARSVRSDMPPDPPPEPCTRRLRRSDRHITALTALTTSKTSNHMVMETTSTHLSVCSARRQQYRLWGLKGDDVLVPAEVVQAGRRLVMPQTERCRSGSGGSRSPPMDATLGVSASPPRARKERHGERPLMAPFCVKTRSVAAFYAGG